MKVDVRKVEDVVIVDFEGRLVAGDAVELLASVINELLAEGWKKILLNLAHVDFIDSMGLGELVQSYKVAQRFGASMHLLKPQDRIRKTLNLTKLLPLFPTHESETEALSTFAG